MNKYVIWGAGFRGEKLKELLTKERIVAFIDSDLSKVGKRKGETEIIDFETYHRYYRDLFIIIAVADYEEIESFLREKGVYQYFILSECPSELKGYGISDLERLLEFAGDRLGNNIIVGSNLFSCLLYEKLCNDGCEELFCYSNECRHPETIRKMERLLHINFVFKLKDMIQKTSKAFITTREKRNIDAFERKGIECINAYDFSYKIAEYYNPNLERFKNKHSNERCFIVATGSSLDVGQVDILYDNREICFGVNRIYNLESERWLPDYYVAVDTLFLKKYHKEILAYPAKIKFVDEIMGDEKENEEFFKVHCVTDDIFQEPPLFSEDVARVVYGGATVTYACIQIAVYMGFKEIYLLGVDCNYCKGSNSNYFFREQKADVMNHKEDRMVLSYESAREYADSHGIKIYNATRGGMLEVFERVDFDSLFQ